MAEPEPKIEFIVDARQFRDMAGRFTKYSEELRRTRLQPWAEQLAGVVKIIAREEIPSHRVGKALQSQISYTTGRGSGTRVRLYFPDNDVNQLALWLLEGVAPHVIPKDAPGLMWWDNAEKPPVRRGLPHRKTNPYQPEHALWRVYHPGFRGYDYLTKIEDEVIRTGILAPGGMATRFAKDAEFKLLHTPSLAKTRGMLRRITAFKELKAKFPGKFGGK